ncbi:hypothetical protein K505DRAFT_372760 [Melanomma pulvis-pyrius CBS 109.77]|uniref:Uncharacterized protein n=1 Tax=Melanomma pulvis-pyrius CBS 109.77 TaxID=1314802 RepID=A0A6A6XN96_9PLEO|nr:hypothetical protein K505DRAFT_372760 [Melanomma pulvis-pyrius CBS 109.77]
MSLRRFGREEPPFPLALRAPPPTLRHTCQSTSVPKPPPDAIERARRPQLFAERIPPSAVPPPISTPPPPTPRPFTPSLHPVPTQASTWPSGRTLTPMICVVPPPRANKYRQRLWRTSSGR